MPFDWLVSPKPGTALGGSRRRAIYCRRKRRVRAYPMYLPHCSNVTGCGHVFCERYLPLLFCCAPVLTQSSDTYVSPSRSPASSAISLLVHHVYIPKISKARPLPLSCPCAHQWYLARKPQPHPGPPILLTGTTPMSGQQTYKPHASAQPGRPQDMD